MSVSGKESVPSPVTISGGGRRVLETLGFEEKYQPEKSGPCLTRASLRTHPMPPRTIQESHRPRVSDRTMRCHSFSGQPSGLLVSENEWRRHYSEMEPQGKRNRSPLYTRRRNRTLDLSKTTLQVAVRVQTFRLNAEKIIPAPSRRGGFSLDIPFYRTFPVTALIRT